MMTAVLALFGLSSCATLFIVAAVALKARVNLSEGDACATSPELTSQSGKSGSVVPAFSH